MNLIQKTTNLNGLLKSTSYVSAYPSTSVFSLVVAEKAVREENPKYFLNVNSMYSLVTNGTGFIRAVSGVTSTYSCFDCAKIHNPRNHLRS